MRRALDLYRRLIGIQIRGQLQYPAAFVLDMIGAGLTTGVWFLSLTFVFQRFQGLGGWSLGEVAFLYGTVETAFGCMDLLFSGFDPPDFGQQVRRGTFDQLLLRPVNVELQVLGSRLIIRRLGRVLQGLVIFGLALAWTDIHWTPDKLLLMPAVIAAQVCFFGGLFIAGSAVTFWTVESIEVVNILTYGGSEMLSYPAHIYPDVLRKFFTYVLPAVFLNYYPALYVLGKPDPLGLPASAALLAPLVGPGVLALALAFWRFGIRHYQSTGT